MAKSLSDEERRLRKLTSAELADEVGALKAEIGDRNAAIDVLKAEAVRRGLTEADGSLFRITLSPPGEQQRIDKEMLESVFGTAFVQHFSKTVPTDWSMRCYGRKAQSGAKAAA